ncbi:MAG TPA: PC4/YdbC family ssDNA-binding protein [Clostridium sp.]|uniref:PC4/YdbC family ssDNA-binding protein n=1 Tax=Clostridium sp. TaxID=1506 RepID=UPI002F942014
MKNLDYIKYPQTTKILIEEIKRACDDYIARRINENELENIILTWADNVGEKMFNGSYEFSPTVIQRVGTGVLSEDAKGWKREINIVSWNDRKPKIDIRDWDEDHLKMRKGITVSKEELNKLKEILNAINIVELDIG